MSHTFYNSLDLTCKSPFGAVKAGQPVTFNLTVPEDLGYVDPHLVLTKDCEDPVHYRMEFTGQTPKVNHFALTVTPTTSGLYFYHFDLYTDFRRIYRTPGGEGVLSWTDGQDWQLTVYEPDFKTPDWLKNGTMYQIFPDRFCEGKPNKAMPFADRIYRADKTGEPYFWPTEQSEGYLNMDYYGGDFAGIQQKLPYLRDLGVTCIYLNPIFEAHANHRYNTANYLKADPLLGTNKEFSALCAAAAREGIRIILDGVFSHTAPAPYGRAHMHELQQKLLACDLYVMGQKNEDPNDLALRASVSAGSEQPGFEAKNVISGVTRREGEQSNLWRSAALGEGGETLTLTLAEPAPVHEVRLVFDPDLSEERCISVSKAFIMKEPRGVAQTLVRDYRVELLRAGEPVASQTVTANHQRRNAVSFDGTLCDSVRVHVLATNGCEEARIYEIRVY